MGWRFATLGEPQMSNPLPQVSHMLADDLQRSNEYTFGRTHINKRIDSAIRSDATSEGRVHQGVTLLNDWLNATHTYPEKTARLAQLDTLHLEQLVRDIFINIAHCQRQELFVTVTAQLAYVLGFADHRDAILTVAEIVSVLCNTDAFDINKESKYASLTIQSKVYLPPELIDSIENCQYLPPMVSEPEDITSNFECPHLTFNSPMLLGKNNTHAGNLCLDVANIQNKVALQLNTTFLSTVEEEPTHDLDTVEKLHQWKQFKAQSYDIYTMLVKQGNQFWLTHKYDKRGRQYAQGYHVTSQGSAFKKAMLELHTEELIEGAPNGEPARKIPTC
jgi:hypothetical protein